jgi:hypothetical protein
MFDNGLGNFSVFMVLGFVDILPPNDHPFLFFNNEECS